MRLGDQYEMRGSELTLKNNHGCGDAGDRAYGAQSQHDAKQKHDPLEFCSELSSST